MTWGYPFLLSAQGLDAGTVSALMALFVATAIVAGPGFGRFVSKHPMRRSAMVLLIALATALAWAAVLVLPDRAPLWLLAVLVVVLAVGGPGSMIGFDFARTFNPSHRIGTATGIVNVGGFIAALVAIYLIGLVLDLLYASGFSGRRFVRACAVPHCPQRSVCSAWPWNGAHPGNAAEGAPSDGIPGDPCTAADGRPCQAAPGADRAAPCCTSRSSGGAARRSAPAYCWQLFHIGVMVYCLLRQDLSRLEP